MNAPTITRQLLHTREIVCRGYLRSDGLLDVDGCIQDVPAEASDLPFHRVEAGDPVHDMRLLMTLDTNLLIQSITAVTSAGATPVCGAIASAYASLAGLKIGPGFKQEVKARVGGTKGCTHLTELVERMASAAMQVRFTLGRAQQMHLLPGTEPPARRHSWVLDTCHAYRRDGEVVRLLGLVSDTPAGPPKS
ncbi:DUF2889 domain-containing protein [Pseudomonas sp. BN102]|uniref:DUF2889 domain-containing protein n=1 Tax=Pseudomonas sp. BN102 TaxID=2567886 RepID=UPI00245636D9|nr:DUF2889 domain-containing protein [Pseudomonas sp. BN102]MDH4610448.1 DUF2889 domain-containing protein [Pseudomonas sp. BN102]